MCVQQDGFSFFLALLFLFCYWTATLLTPEAFYAWPYLASQLVSFDKSSLSSSVPSSQGVKQLVASPKIPPSLSQDQTLAELQNNMMLVKLDLRKKAACIAEQYHTVQKLQAPPTSAVKKRFCANRENLQPNQPPGKKPFLHNFLSRSATRPVAARGWQLRSVALWLFTERSLPHYYWNRWQIQYDSICFSLCACLLLL